MWLRALHFMRWPGRWGSNMRCRIDESGSKFERQAASGCDGSANRPWTAIEQDTLQQRIFIVTAITQSEIFSSLWKSCEDLRGGMDVHGTDVTEIATRLYRRQSHRSRPRHRHILLACRVCRRAPFLLHHPGPAVTCQPRAGHQNGAPAITLVQVIHRRH